MAQRTGPTSDSRGTQEAQLRTTTSKIAASPDPFNGNGDWQEWIDAFEVCGDLNGWTDKEKLQWLQLRLTGAAARTFRRLGENALRCFDSAKAALAEAFQSPGQQLIQEMAFRSKRRQPTEPWASHAEALLSLAEKAYPHLDARSIDAMVNAQLLQSVEDPHLQYLVRRAMPTTVADSVRELTIQQALLQATFLHSSPVIASAEPTQTRPSEPPIAAEFQSRLHSLEESIHKLQRMMIHDRGEHVMPVDDRPRRFSLRSPTQWERRRTQFWKCQGFGHIARQCPSASGNGEGSSARTGRMTRSQ